MSVTSAGWLRPTSSLSNVNLVIMGFAVCGALMLALPGQTMTARYINDVMIFLDGVHRVSLGQVPNRDFHSALGPLTYYLPALGLWLTGSYGAALPTGCALLIVFLAPVMAHILRSRLSSVIAVPFGAFLVLLLAAPINVGESATALSFGMFYNRIGWAVLALLLVLYLTPRSHAEHRPSADGASAVLLTLILLYLKLSYGLFALAFLGLVLLQSRQRRWAAGALIATAMAAAVVEIVWRGTLLHLQDVQLAAAVSGTLRGTPGDHLRLALTNLPDYTAFAILIGLALQRSRDATDALFYTFCAASGFLIMNQNFQNLGMITIVAGGAVAIESLMRAGSDHAVRGANTTIAAGQILLAVLLIPTGLNNALALGLHTVLGTARAGAPYTLPAFDDLRIVDVWSPGDYRFSANYISSLRNGAAALASFVPDADRVFVLDFVSPFSAGLDLQPPRGDSAWQHWGRTFNDEHFMKPEELLHDVRVLMDPKWPIEAPTADGLRRIYGPYIQEHFSLVGENVDWRVYVAK